MTSPSLASFHLLLHLLFSGSAAARPLAQCSVSLMSVPLQVAGVQEVGGDPQRREGAGRARWHGEVQPLHVVQAGV